MSMEGEWCHERYDQIYVRTDEISDSMGYLCFEMCQNISEIFQKYDEHFF